MTRFSPALSPSQEAALKRDTAQRVAKALTRGQADGMRRVRDRGSLAWAAGKGRAGGAVARMFDRLCDNGLVRGPPYEVTEFGLRVLAELDAAAGAPHER